MSWPSFLQGIIDRFKRGEGDSDDDIQAKETEVSRSRQGQRVGACTGSAVSSGVNNIGNNDLLNLDVGPGKRDINSVIESFAPIIPDLSTILHSLRNKCLFTITDLSSAYYSMDLDLI